ncbi:MAG: hypothetical protein V4611_01250 [Patescibacteria group bacterium]
MNGDAFTQTRIAQMTPLLVEQMKDMDLSEAPTFKGHKLLFLGKPTWQADAGNVKCDRLIYLGDDGKFYVEGPRKSFGKFVIDIHPYTAEDAKGWGGIGASNIADYLTTYFI